MAYLISEEAQELLGAVKEFCEKEVKEQCKAVSYTHLTLPTIRLV